MRDWELAEALLMEGLLGDSTMLQLDLRDRGIEDDLCGKVGWNMATPFHKIIAG